MTQSSPRDTAVDGWFIYCRQGDCDDSDNDHTNNCTDDDLNYCVNAAHRHLHRGTLSFLSARRQRPQCAKGKGPEDPGVAAPLYLALVVAATAGILRVSGSSCLSSTSLFFRPTTASRAQLTRGLLGNARQCADMAKIALPLSMVLVVVFCLPNVTPYAPCRRAVKLSRSSPSCLRSTSLFPNGYHHFGPHEKVEAQYVRWKHRTL